MSSSVRDALVAVLGEYTPMEITYDAVVNSVVMFDGVPETVSDVVPVTVMLPDFAWIGGLIVLCLFLFCFFRAVGGLLKCKL